MRDLKERVRASLLARRPGAEAGYDEEAALRFERAFERTRGRLPGLSDLVRAETDGWELPQEPGDNWPEEGAIMWRRRAEELRRCAR
jgi:hypothetical protein